MLTLEKKGIRSRMLSICRNEFSRGRRRGRSVAKLVRLFGVAITARAGSCNNIKLVNRVIVQTQDFILPLPGVHRQFQPIGPSLLRGTSCLDDRWRQPYPLWRSTDVYNVMIFITHSSTTAGNLTFGTLAFATREVDLNICLQQGPIVSPPNHQTVMMSWSVRKYGTGTIVSGGFKIITETTNQLRQ